MKNNRTFLEKLLDGAEVEWKPLKDILIRTKGTKITAAEMKVLHKDNAPLKIFAGGKTFALVNIEDIPEKDINKNPSIIVKSRGIIEFEYYDKPFSHKNEMWSYYSNDKNINIKYIYYVLKNQEPYFQNLGSKMQMPQIATPDTDKYLVPIPPLPVQTEIVRILDALTALTSELTSELTLRRKQYEYYREKLLSFDSLELSGGVVQWVKLINLGELIRGNGLQKKDFTETGVPAIHYGQIYTYYGTFATETKSFVSPELAKKLKKAKYGDVLIAGTSENVKDVMKPLGWLGSEIAFSGDMFAFRPNKKVNTKYLTYVLQTERFYKFKEKYAQGTKVIRIRADNFLNYEIPLPPFEEQQRIVSILDKFEILTNSITEGLPLAIEQSQKRYEYYRELLLNFS